MPAREGWIERSKLINLLRAEGYAYKRQADRVEIYRKGTSRVAIPRRDLIPELQVRAMLRQMGFNDVQVEQKISALKM